MKRIAILGSTGSIGVNACSVVADNPSHFEIVALAAGENIALLKQQIDRFRPALVSVIDERRARQLRDAIGPTTTEVVFGEDGCRQIATAVEAEMVVSAMVGAAGLLPTLAAIDAKKDIALANKEAMVMAGNIVVERALAKGVRVIPIDSEHSAIFQCLVGHRREDVRRIILTASGGPFLEFAREDLSAIKPAQALRHPNWQMGPKITVDSATLMNKGLEVIEARWFFGVDVGRVDVLIHRRSIVHSLVEYLDGSIIAQLSVPDMRIPIGYALSYPERLDGGGRISFLDLAAAGALEFTEPDLGKFPALRLAYEAARAGGTAPAALNAANEIAVAAFLEEKITFTAISRIIEDVLSVCETISAPGIEAILEADRWARGVARRFVEGQTC